jgi:hypothetical protein
VRFGNDGRSGWEKALAVRDTWMLWIATDPRFDNLRLDSRFDELIRRVGLK